MRIVAITTTLLAAGAVAVGATVADGRNDPAVTKASSATPSQTAATLTYMREEEKLARDVYTVLAGTSGDPRFARIAMSEQRHMDAVLRQLQRYGISDPAAGLAPGEFRNDTLERLYDRLVAKGTASPAAALAVGRTIERTDIADIDARIDETPAPVARVLAHLRAGSERHLAAFGG